MDTGLRRYDGVFLWSGVWVMTCDNVDRNLKRVGAHTRDITHLDSGVRPQNDKGRI